MPITETCFMEMVNDMERELNVRKEEKGHRHPVHQRQGSEEAYRDAISECIKKYSLYYNREHCSHSFA